MDVQLQELIDKIKKDGVASAENEAAKIVAEAEKNAEKIIADAQEKAAEIVKKANVLFLDYSDRKLTHCINEYAIAMLRGEKS